MVSDIHSMNQPWVYMRSLSWNSLTPPSPSHLSESSQCTSPEHPASCIEPGLAIYFTYDNTHVSMLFSQIIPPLPSPTESNCLFLTSASLLLSHIYGHHYHLSKFHIYALINCINWSLCIIGSNFTHLIRTDSNAFLFNGWLIFHGVYVSQLSYPFVCHWTFRLLPCPGYCKQSYSEHWGTRVSFNSGFLGVYAQQWDFWVIWQF